ncbi:hypothetical protein JCM10296v2_006864 [Rhodotorula toruloides]
MTPAGVAAESPPPRPSIPHNRCADIWDAFKGLMTVREWLQELIVPLPSCTAKSGGHSSSRKKKDKIEALTALEDAAVQPKPQFDVKDIVGDPGILNTATGPVAVVLYPHLTKLLPSWGFDWLTTDTPINIDTAVSNLYAECQRDLQHAAMSVNDIAAAMPPVCQEQNEKFAERQIAYIQQLMGYLLRVVKKTVFNLSMTPSAIPAHIPDCLIWFGNSLRGLIEVKKGRGNLGVVNTFSKWWEKRMGTAPEVWGLGTVIEGVREVDDADLYDLCSLSDMPGSTYTGVQNLFGKIVQSARSADRERGSVNDLSLLIIHDFTTFIPALLVNSMSMPPQFPVPSVYKRAKKAETPYAEPQKEFTAPDNYEPYILFIGAHASLNSRFSSTQISYPFVLASAALASTDLRSRLVSAMSSRRTLGVLLSELGLRGDSSTTGGTAGDASPFASSSMGPFGFPPSMTNAPPSGARGASCPTSSATA